MSLNRARFSKTLLVLLIGAITGGFQALALSPSAAAGSTRNVSPQFEALSLQRSPQNHLIVRVFINGKSAMLGVDTGAPVSAIATSRRQHYGLSPIPGTSKLPPRLMINGAFNAVGIAKSLRIGALNLVDEPMVAINLGPESRAARIRGEQEIDGIIGADILFPTRAVLDCERQLLILKTNPEVFGSVPGFDRRGLRAVPIQVSDDYNLYVNGSVNGKSDWLQIDTGSFANLLFRTFVRRMRIATQQ